MKPNGTMKVHEAARKVIEEEGRFIPYQELTRIMLDRGLVKKTAKDPMASIGGTIRKYVSSKYNSLGLVNRDGMIGLETMTPEGQLPARNNGSTRKLAAEVPTELYDQIQLACQAKIADSHDSTVALLIRKGLSALAKEIRQRLLDQLGGLS